MVPSRADDAAHVIRLHGPWEGTQCGVRNAECGIDEAVAPKPDRVKVPLNFGDWLDADFRGAVVLERAFGLPTNLDKKQSVHLVLSIDRPMIGSVSLNENRLPPASNVSQAASPALVDTPDDDSLLRYEITSLLKVRNRLRLILTVDSQPSDGLTYAAIEISGC